MKRTILALSLIFSMGCDKDSPPEDATKGEKIEIPTSKELVKEAKDGAQHVIDKKGEKWTVTYKGDLSGEIKGRIMSAVTMPMFTTALGKGMAPDMKSTAKSDVSVRFSTSDKEDPTLAQVKFTLDDGTKCKMEPGGKMTVDLKDKEAKTLHANFTGEAVCDGDKKVTFDIKMNAKP